MNTRRIRKYTTAGLLAAALVVTFLWTSGNALAREWGGSFGHGHGSASMLGLVKKLDLSAGQKTQVAAILTAHRASLTATHERAAATRQDLVARMTSDTVDEQAVSAALDAAAAAHKELALAWTRVRQEMQALLTPAQLAQVAEMRDRFVTRMEERHAGTKERGTERFDRLIDELTR